MKSRVQCHLETAQLPVYDMSKITNVTATEGYTVITWERWTTYINKRKAVKASCSFNSWKATCEISLNTVPAGFFHSHKKPEEVHRFTQGSGKMQLDDKVIPLGEASRSHSTSS